MRPDLATVTGRVAALRRAAARGPAREDLLEQIEEMLSEGYAYALAGDAWSIRAEERMHELIERALADQRVGLRALAADHARFQRELIALRAELSELRRARDRLGAPAHRG